MEESKPRILVSESSGFSQTAVALLSQAADVVLADLDRPALLQALGEVEVMWVRLRHQIDGEVMDAAPRLRVIVTPTTGLNHIDVGEAGRRGVQVLSLRGETDFLKDVRATAEHTIALTLTLLRHMTPAREHVLCGGWDRDRFRGRELHGKTVGIVGYGRLGRIVARCFGAFGMGALAADPRVPPDALESGVVLVELDELLKRADVVSLHVDLTDRTKQFFGRDQFRLMKSGSWLINTARGELVNEAALLEALESGRLAGAALDVLSGERSDGMGDHPLVAYARGHDNLLITPHIGGCTLESMEKTEVFLAERLCASWLASKGGFVR